MSVPDSFDRITRDNLEASLDFYKNNPLPEWFPTKKLKETDYNRYNFNDGLILVNVTNREYIEHGLTVLPYIQGHLSYIEAGDIVISYPFSGCLMASFSFPEDSDKRYVGHIAKGDAKVKHELCDWFKNDNRIHEFCIFDPFDLVEDNSSILDFLGKCGYKFNFQKDIYGIITRSNERYSFLIGTTEDGAKNIILWAKFIADGNMAVSFKKQ